MDKLAGVEAYLKVLDHPEKETVLALRQILRTGFPALTEGIKWNAPSYAVGDRHVVTMLLRPGKPVTLVFHTGTQGVETKTGRRLLAQPALPLEWSADQRALAVFAGLADLEAKKDGLKDLVAQWLAAVGT